MDLFLKEEQGVIEALCCSSEKRVCYSASRCLGSIGDIAFDQRMTPVPWTLVSLPDYCRKIDCDSRQNEMIPGHEPKIEDLNYEIANAMTATLEDRGFSRYAKKMIPGQWMCSTSTLQFHADGSYSISGVREDVDRMIPGSGRWFFGGRMMHFMNQSVDAGVRTPVVSISESELRFHGRNQWMFQVYERR